MRSQFPSCLSPARAGPEARAQAAGCHGDGWKPPATVTVTVGRPSRALAAAVASAMTTATVTVTVTAAFSETGVTRNAVAAGPRSWSISLSRRAAAGGAAGMASGPHSACGSGVGLSMTNQNQAMVATQAKDSEARPGQPLPCQLPPCNSQAATPHNRRRADNPTGAVTGFIDDPMVPFLCKKLAHCC